MTPKEVLVAIVNSHQGIKGTSLGVEFVLATHKEGTEIPDDFDVVQVLEELVTAGELVEIEYAVPEMEYRVKSFYLPKGSLITGYYLPKGTWVKSYVKRLPS